MLRRTFFKFMGSAVVGASLAAHEALGELVPLPFLPAKVVEWWYLVEVGDHYQNAHGRYVIRHIVSLREADLVNYGLKPEDFPIRDEGTWGDAN